MIVFALIGKEIEKKIMMKKNPCNRYVVNINPGNTGMKNFLKNAGFELIQYTYEVPKRINRG